MKQDDKLAHRGGRAPRVRQEAAAMRMESAKPVPRQPRREKGQDPHQIGGARDNTLEVSIGREVHAFRTKLGITVADLAAAAKLSPGMLSKIENGLTSPSLNTLQGLSIALGVPVTAFFRRYEERRDAVFVKSGQG